MDFSDAMIFVGSMMTGAYSDNNTIIFAGGLVASLGINIQFEQTRLSIARIVALSALGYFLGAQNKKKTN